ncbi:hypothetical protein [Frankia sp. CiP1_Cm_nod1]|uniref:hypothetical protein n=1 Tax=Frankia sp. CiP1_Cm_nod1 TaxID=2897160 RepID=UPI0020246201
MPRPDTAVTVVRISSNVETYLPSGTRSSPTSSRRISTGVASRSTRWIRSCSTARTSATARASTVIPGSSTRSPSSHSTARSNSSRRDGVDVHTREATNARSCSSATLNGR